MVKFENFNVTLKSPEGSRYLYSVCILELVLISGSKAKDSLNLPPIIVAVSVPSSLYVTCQRSKVSKPSLYWHVGQVDVEERDEQVEVDDEWVEQEEEDVDMDERVEQEEEDVDDVDNVEAVEEVVLQLDVVDDDVVVVHWVSAGVQKPSHPALVFKPPIYIVPES